MEEGCEQCGLDAGALDMADTAARLRALPTGYREAVAGVGHDALRRRRDEHTWSALEYVAHARDAVRYHGALIRDALTSDDPTPRDSVNPDAVVLDLNYNAEDPAQTLDGLEANVERFAGRIETLEPAEVDRSIPLSGMPRTVGFLAHSALHEVHHHLDDVRSQLGVR